MFDIMLNNFISNGKVVYADKENGNKLFVECEKNGSAFKIYGTAGVAQRRIVQKYKYPYDMKELKLSFEDGFPIRQEEVMPLLEISSIIERWIDICNNLVALFSNEMSTFARLTSKSPAEADKREMEIVGNLLDELEIYEEMQEFVKKYVEIVQSIM